MSILEEIFAHKQAEIARQKRARQPAEVRAAAEAAPPPSGFAAALRPRGPERPALIAEVKCSSPSRGRLAKDFDPLRLARIYRENGAAAISVLTDERFFGGSLEHLAQIRRDQAASGLPLLRKDFLCDPYQVYQARAAGADAVLLIAAALETGLLGELHALALSLGMAPLVEVHSERELETALRLAPVLVGINNRDLHNFTVSLETTLRLRPEVPAGVKVVAESGIHTPADVARLGAAGVDAILVGEALVTAEDPAGKVRALSGQTLCGRDQAGEGSRP